MSITKGKTYDASPAAMEARRRYNKKAYRRVSVVLRRENDADIMDYLARPDTESASQIVKREVRRLIAEEHLNGGELK